MVFTILCYAILVISTFPFIYYLLSLYSSWRFFRKRTGADIAEVSTIGNNRGDTLLNSVAGDIHVEERHGRIAI